MATLTETFSAIAAAIRSKSGKAETMTPAEMPAEIEALPTGDNTALFNVLNKANESWPYFTFDCAAAGLTDVPTRAFENGSQLNGVILPGGNIGQRAFYRCSLENIGEIVATTIGQNAFEACTYLNTTKVTLTGGTGTIVLGSGAFSSCYRIPRVAVVGVGRVGTFPFYNCTGITRAWLDSRLSQITASSSSNAPFSNCLNLTDIYTDATEKPEGWGNYFYYTSTSKTATVHYGVSLDEFEQLE